MHKMVVSLLTIGTFAAATSASADTIHITSGWLIGDLSSAEVHLESSDRGFSLTGYGDRIGGVYGPSDCLPCDPGSAQPLDVDFSSHDFPGTVSIDGMTFDMGLHDADPNGTVHFDGKWTAPAHVDQDMATVTSPFTFSGLYSSPANRPYEVIPLVGHGLANITVHWSGAVNDWELSRTDYRFSSDTPAATPEPASLLLLGTGLAGMAFRRRRASA